MAPSRHLGVLAAVTLLATPAGAQTDYPSKPVRIICAYPAGGGVDVTARVLADQLQKLWGQPVTVENRTGAGGNIGAEAVATAEPDGYTLLATAPAPLTVNATLYKKLSYDPTHLVPVAIIALSANALAVRSELPVNSVSELIGHAKANPGKISFASQGNGTTSHLTASLFESRTGIKLNHVPYRGTAPALNDLAGGHVDFMFADLGSLFPLHQSGKIRIIAAGSAERVPAIAHIPTVSESIPNFRSTTWYAFAATPRTPSAVVAKINKAVTDILATPEVQAKYRSLHIEGSKASLTELDEFIKSETRLWSEVIRAANISLD
jgi:tripartite-type tricarboxylate transporter receptor subunit TctC